MNRKTIQKVIDELSKDNPRLDYVRGILETLIESLPEEKEQVNKSSPAKQTIRTTLENIPLDESSLIENSAMAVLNRIDKNAIKTE